MKTIKNTLKQKQNKKQKQKNIREGNIRRSTEPRNEEQNYKEQECFPTYITHFVKLLSILWGDTGYEI